MELNEKMIHDALLRLLKGHDVEPSGYWASVREFPTRHHVRYGVVIAYPAAKKALCEILNFLTGGHEDEADPEAGIWVLTEAQARLLCDMGTRTLADLLYADKTKTFVPETDWIALVQSIAAGDQGALHALYERTHRVVFTLVVRITNHGEAAEEVTLDLFHGLWQRASTYDPATGSVLGWVMSQARSRAIARFEREVQTLRPLMDSSVFWAPQALRPPASLPARLAKRISAETGGEPVLPSSQRWVEPEWEEAAAGISLKLLATDTKHHRVSMLVRLAPGGHYPPHTHAGVEELYLLSGDLWIDERKLYPGDCNRSTAGTADRHVWSETGCTCVLITSTRDLIN